MTSLQYGPTGAWAHALGDSPEWFPHLLDVSNDTVSFIRLSRADYGNASFLDTRIVTPQTTRLTVPWTQVAASIDAARLRERCHFIFHIGHVGSTLLSRLIDRHRSAFCLREPMVLRTFAQVRSEPEPIARAWSHADGDARMSGCLKLLSRSFERDQIVIVKATSFVSELATALLTRPAAPRAMMLFVPPETYLATILGGANSRVEAKMLTQVRLRRLHRRIGQDAWKAETLSEGETLALGWACEMTALAQAALTAGGHVFRLDFERFLANPRIQLLAALRHFEIPATTDEVAAILRGPDMQRYSKAPEYAYDTMLRMEVLNGARTQHAGEIRRGLAWLDRAAARFQPVADAMAFAANPA